MAVESILTLALTLGIFIIFVFAIVSLVLFIVDGVNAKREGRRRKTGFTVMFIVSMTLVGLVVVIIGLLIALISAFMASM